MNATRSTATRSHQRGGMSVTMMLVMLGLVAMLGLVEFGYVFWAKRDAQKVADLAAMAGAQRIDLCVASNSDNSAARFNAVNQNRFPGTLTIQCGSWKEGRAGDRFSSAVDADNPRNAVKVVAERSVLPFFHQATGLPTVRAQAIAKRSPPTAVFSVGSQLLRVNGNTPLGSVLKLVGANLDGTTLLGYDGLAQVKVTPNGLLQALGIPVNVNMGVGEFNDFLAGRTVKLGQILDATVKLLGQQGVANINLSALNNALVVNGVDIKQLDVKLGSDANGGGLFARVVAPDGTISGALQADVNLLDLVTTSISIANGGRGVAINNLSLLGLVTAKAAVVEPPSIAIGGVGARAYTSQVRLVLDVDTNNIPLAGGLLNLLGIRLHLPIHADVTNAMGTLTALQCGTTPPTASIRVDATVLRACVGKVAPGDLFSKRNVCDDTLQREQLLTLLGRPLVNDYVKIAALADTQTLTVPAGETRSTQPNALAVGSTVSALVDELLRVLSNLLNPNNSVATPSQVANDLADRYLKLANPGNGFYDANKTIKLLREGDPATNLQPLGDWTVKDGVPYACGLLNLATCHRDGSVWDGYRATVTGEGLGVLDGVLGSLLGGLVINRCNSLVSALLAYNNCVKGNLAAYLQTKPGGLTDPTGGGVTTPGNNSASCSGLLCVVLSPVINALKPILNSVGTLLMNLLSSVLGLELGRTDVHVQSIQCTPAQLVY
ncbi:TadG family pilus assembly protein [Stenotrophomonas sp. 24(2023)]|uniref:TadG family pilus assembly protein n=1 Tax=Stenotrophomonas sp. 24(2023) TaxID=3068324 RepID=UPI0027E209DA|nr:TadG family pilus assembly protein [Stenotrophomonas sp. 24(2023)]WMJ69499.1 TadG family pilus assembly protein [Stenotrophomonas sp. 24(2023)]